MQENKIKVTGQWLKVVLKMSFLLTFLTFSKINNKYIVKNKNQTTPERSVKFN